MFTSSSTSSTPSAVSGSPTAPLSSTTVTIQSTSTASSAPSFSQTPSSTSERPSAPQSHVSNSDSASIGSSISAQSTPNDNVSSAKNSSIRKPEKNNSSQSNAKSNLQQDHPSTGNSSPDIIPPVQQIAQSNAKSNLQQDHPSTGNSSPDIIPPVQQIEELAQLNMIFPSTTQSIPSNQAPEPHAPFASIFPSSHLPSGPSGALIKPSVPVETVGLHLTNIEALASALPTTLVTYSQSLLSSSVSGDLSEAQRTLNTNLPIETAANPVLAGPTPDTTPVGDVHQDPGHAEPSIGAAHSSTDNGYRLSPAAIAGISIGIVAGLAITVFLIWSIKRRSKKGSFSTGSLASRGDEEPFSRGWCTSSTFRPRIGNSRSDTSESLPVSNSIWSSSSTCAGHAATDMAERRVRIVSQPAFLRGAPSNRQVLRPNTAERMFSKSYDAFSDQNTTGLPLQNPSLPPTALFGAPSPGQVTRDADAMSPQYSASHGRSLSGAEWASQYSASSAMPTRPHFVHRDSSQSVDLFTNVRNKICSKPFDLETESRHAQKEASMPRMPPYLTAGRAPIGCAVSNSSSRYTSGVSAGDCSVLREGQPYDPASVATGPTRQFVTWDCPDIGNASEPGDQKWFATPARQSQYMVGQAL
ncbi:hypothetical protein E4U55_006142 [Claviceps digitariae]|nr:hypothetical protein E4U55_006142 [Claviceps digitariae]